MKSIERQTYAPFGVRTDRSCRVGFHPGLDKNGVMKKPTPIGPGEYNVGFVQCWRNKAAVAKFREPWKRKQDLEEFSKTLGYRNADVLRDREEDKKKRGPGSIDINADCFKKCEHNEFEDLTFGKSKRFPKTIVNSNPGPGSYGKNHDPFLRRKEASLPIRQWTKLQPFEWDGFVDRFRIGRIKKSTSVPPNRYNIKSQSIQAILDKKVSKRGPYDCFTGPRDYTTIKGYFAINPNRGPKNWPFALPSDVDRFKTKTKARYGCFLQSKRFHENMSLNGPIDFNIPGPAYYTTEKPKSCEESKYPFNQSVINCRPTTKWEVKPGVGRYSTVDTKCSYTVQGSWPFKSKSERKFYTIITYNAF